MRWIGLAMALLACRTISADTVTAYTDVAVQMRGWEPELRQGDFFMDVRIDGVLSHLGFGGSSVRWQVEIEGDEVLSLRPSLNPFRQWQGSAGSRATDTIQLSDGLWLDVSVSASDIGNRPGEMSHFPPRYRVQLTFQETQFRSSFEEPLDMEVTEGDLDFPAEPPVVTSVQRLSEELGPETWRIGFRGPNWEVHQTVLDRVVAGRQHHTIVLERAGWTDVSPLVFGVPEPPTWLLALLALPWVLLFRPSA